MGWVALGAPLDSAAAGEGEERAPAALREAGLVERLGAQDLGDVAPPLRPAERDPATGVIAIEALTEASVAISSAVADVLASGNRPLVLGGDCSLLVGVFAALRLRGLDPGLLFVDGHCDYWDGDSSPTGEFADMELATLHGHGPEALTRLAEGPMLAPERTAILGHRPPGLHEDVAAERERVPAEVLQIDTKQLKEGGVDEPARRALEAAGSPVWLHLDLDVLDESALPAVSYPQAEGLGWEELAELLGPLLAAPGLLGLSVADFNADLDPDGAHALRIVELLQRAVAHFPPP